MFVTAIKNNKVLIYLGFYLIAILAEEQAEKHRNPAGCTGIPVWLDIEIHNGMVHRLHLQGAWAARFHCAAGNARSQNAGNS